MLSIDDALPGCPECEGSGYVFITSPCGGQCTGVPGACELAQHVEPCECLYREDEED